MTSAAGRNSPVAAVAGVAATGRRAELLALAAHLFATKGFANTTVRDIGDEAGILSGSLYHHFASKEAILDQILREFIEGLHLRFTEIVGDHESPREALDALIRGSFAVIHEQTDAVALYQNEIAWLPQQAFVYVHKMSKLVEDVWLRVLEAGREAGDFRTDLDVPIVYRFIRDSIWASAHWYTPRGPLKSEVIAEEYLEFLHGGLLAGATKR